MCYYDDLSKGGPKAIISTEVCGFVSKRAYLQFKLLRLFVRQGNDSYLGDLVNFVAAWKMSH